MEQEDLLEAADQVGVVMEQTLAVVLLLEEPIQVAAGEVMGVAPALMGDLE